MQGVQVRYLVGELRSHMLCGCGQKKKSLLKGLGLPSALLLSQQIAKTQSLLLSPLQPCL